jgi:hypothetical protein
MLAALYERYTAGEPTRSILRWLNDAGITTIAGGQWTNDSLIRVLASGFAAGLLHIHDPACNSGGSRCDVPRCARRVYIKGAHEPVITPEQWDAFRAHQEVRRQTPARLRDPAYPLSGLLFCRTTEHRLTGSKDAGGAAYRCLRKAEGHDCPGAFVRAATAEQVVLEWLAQWAADIEAAAAVEAARLRATTPAQVGGDALAKREAALEGQLARLMGRWAADERAEEAAYEMARAPPRPRSPRQRHRHHTQQRRQQRGPPRIPAGQTLDLLGERGRGTARSIAEEPAHRQPDHHLPPADRDMIQPPLITAVHPGRGLAAPRAHRGIRPRPGPDVQPSPHDLGVFHDHTGQVRQQHLKNANMLA